MTSESDKIYDAIMDQFADPLTDSERISALEAEIERLKALIIEMVTVDGTQEKPFTVREVVQKLFTWAH